MKTDEDRSDTGQRARRRHRRCTWGIAMGTWFAVMAANVASNAQTAAPAPANASADASQLYEAGLRAAKREQWQVAHDAFLAAWHLRQHAQIALNLARAELKLGKHRDAAEHLAFFLASGTSELNADERALVQQMFDGAKARVGAVTFDVDRRGAEVLVDGVAAGTSPVTQTLYVEPGKRVIQARLPGGETTEVTVEIAAGTTLPVALRFGDRGAVEAPPANAMKMKEGVALGVPPPDPPHGRNNTLVLGGIAATAVAAGVGVAFAVAWNGKLQDQEALLDDQECGDSARCRGLDLAEYNRLGHAGEGLGNTAFFTLVGAGVIGLGTLTYVLLTPAPERPDAKAASVAVGVGPGGVSVRTRW